MLLKNLGDEVALFSADVNAFNVPEATPWSTIQPVSPEVCFPPTASGGIHIGITSLDVKSTYVKGTRPCALADSPSAWIRCHTLASQMNSPPSISNLASMSFWLISTSLCPEERALATLFVKCFSFKSREFDCEIQISRTSPPTATDTGFRSLGPDVNV